MTKTRLIGICAVLVVVCLIVITAGWIVGRRPGLSQFSEADLQTLSEFESLHAAHVAGIADADEPGERLILCLTFVSESEQVPLSHESVSFYHTDADGDYEPQDPNDESTARLKGSATTDVRGRILVQTILPGDYGSSADNRHIHLTVPAAKPSAYDIHFSQYSTFMLRRFVASSNQHFLADLKQDNQGQLIAFMTIQCQLKKAD